MPLIQLIGTILVYYVVFLGAIALTYYIGSLCWRFFRGSRKTDGGK